MTTVKCILIFEIEYPLKICDAGVIYTRQRVSKELKLILAGKLQMKYFFERFVSFKKMFR